MELYNPDPLPVALGGLYLSDAPDGSPQRHELAALSFIAGRNFQTFTADGDPEDGADHLSFRLDLHQESLGLCDAQLNAIDTIVYGPQTPGFSQGRLPDGAAAIAFFARPTPNWLNGAGTPGDFNGDDRVDATDIDLLAAAIRTGSPFDPSYDLNRDALVDFDDLSYLVQTVLDTTFGDTDLDGIFNSQDFILVFQVGQYEDNVPGNSGWSDGDWNGDGDFSSDDIVLAFQYGGYSAEARPMARQAAAIDGYFANLAVQTESALWRVLCASAPSALQRTVKLRE